MYGQNKQSLGIYSKVCTGILYSCTQPFVDGGPISRKRVECHVSFSSHNMKHCEANPEEDSGVATLASGHGMSWGADEGHGFADVVLDFRQEISMMAK